LTKYFTSKMKGNQVGLVACGLNPRMSTTMVRVTGLMMHLTLTMSASHSH